MTPNKEGNRWTRGIQIRFDSGVEWNEMENIQVDGGEQYETLHRTCLLRKFYTFLRGNEQTLRVSNNGRLAVLLVLWCLLFAKQLVGRVDAMRKSSRDSLDELYERHRIAISTTINSNQPLSSKNNAQIRDNSTQARLLSTNGETRLRHVIGIERLVKGFPIVLIAPDFNLLIT